MKTATGIGENYVPSWGFWEGLRELVANGRDGEVCGWPLAIEYQRSRGRQAGDGTPLRIINRGAELPLSTWALGETTKRGDSRQIGEKGEGYKLACMVLLRLGCRVLVRTSDVVYEPTIEASPEFGGARVLVINSRPAARRSPDLVFEVWSIDDETWATVQRRCLFLQTDIASVDLGNGSRILTDPEFAGKLYTHGLYVGPLPDSYNWGYDLHDIELDRDRRMADAWSLRSKVVGAIRMAVETSCMRAGDILQLLSRETGEARAVLDTYQWQGSDSLSRALVDAWKSEHGDAVPVSDMAESVEAAAGGLKAKLTSRALKTALEKEMGAFAQRVTNRKLEVDVRYGVEELTGDEMATVRWLVSTVGLVDQRASLAKLSIVDFVGPDVRGRWMGDESIALAKRTLSDRAGALETYVHELCHDAGADGSLAHSFAQTQLLSRLVAGLADLAGL